MNRIKFGIIAGFAFGGLDVLPMFGMDLPNPTLAISGAFINCFVIGFLVPIDRKTSDSEKVDPD